MYTIEYSTVGDNVSSNNFSAAPRSAYYSYFVHTTVRSVTYGNIQSLECRFVNKFFAPTKIGSRDVQKIQCQNLPETYFIRTKTNLPHCRLTCRPIDLTKIVSPPVLLIKERRQKKCKMPRDPKPLTLKDAEAKLDNPKIENESINLRSPLFMPEEVYAEQVYLEISFDKMTKKLAPKVQGLVQEVQEDLHKALFPKYCAEKKESAKLLLKFYIEEVSEGSRESRIYAPDSGHGLVKLKFSWYLCTIDELNVLDGGRHVHVDSHWNGLFDTFFPWSTGKRTLIHNLLPQSYHQVDARTGIRTMPWWK